MDTPTREDEYKGFDDHKAFKFAHLKVMEFGLRVYKIKE
jgi:hypothetical protein